MLKTIIAGTRECDDVDVAVEEILSQLKLDQSGTLKKNTVGIIASYRDFVFSGVYKAVCDKLPFDVLGGISSTQSANGEDYDLIFSIIVLTSDDISFKSVLTSSVLEDADKAVRDAYGQAVSGGDIPSFACIYAPYIVEKNCGDTYVHAFNRASGNGIVSPVPLFGTLSIDDSPDSAYPVVLYNGEYYDEQAAMLFFYGEIKFKFYSGTVLGADPYVSKEKSKNVLAISSEVKITAAKDNRIYEVNGRPVADFLSGLGMLETSKKLFSMVGFPFLVDLHDGTPASLNYFTKYFEGGKYMLCGGDVYVGSTMRLYHNDSNSIIETTRAALNRANEENPNPELFLSYSCQGREWDLGAADQAGAEKVLFDKMMSGINTNRAIVYSGGEICPAGKVGNNYANRFQGQTFTLVVFYN
ncbi:hypothetical protein FACS1894190_01730 [Spirochaetia bacterium]|nr:hypothetical protein FACS1894190_01730 [Spirochaetia bacterium]